MAQNISGIQKFHKFARKGMGTSKEERSNVYALVLAKAWREINEQKKELEMAVEGTSMRHSMSGKCSRQIHYYLAKQTVTNPFDLPAVWATGLGSRIHTWWQEALVAAFPNCKVEVSVHLPEADSSGHVDAVITEETSETTTLELKSINGFGFKKLAEGGDGPRYGDMVQCCVNAYGLGSTKAVLVYMSLEAVSRSRAKSKGLAEHERIMKEFHFDEAQINLVAKAEIARWATIREAGDQAPRYIPDPEFSDRGVVGEPSSGKMIKDGKVSSYYWGCGYCSYRDKCQEDCNADNG